MKRVAIIGGGIGGLATANLLALAGHEVDVYEKNDYLGGRAGRRDINGFRFDTGPSWYLMPEVFEQYFRLCGRNVAKELDLIKLSPSYTVFFEHDAPITITSNLETDAHTFDTIESGAGAALRSYVERGTRLYDMSIRHFLYTNFQDMRDLIRGDILKQLPFFIPFTTKTIDRYVSEFFTDARLKKIIEYPMVFLGTSPFQAPALYSLMSALDFTQGVYYPQGGMYAIIERLVDIGEKAGVSYHTSVPCESIVVDNGEAVGVKVGGEMKPCDIVVSNADIHFTETVLLAPEHQSFPSSYWKKKDPGLSAFLLYLGVKGELPNLTHHSLLFVDAWKKNFEDIYTERVAPNPASIYICNPSKIDPSTAPEGHENLFILVPFPTSVDLDDTTRDQLAEQYLEQIEHMIGVPDLRERIVVRDYFTPQDFSTYFNSWNNTALGASHILRQSALFRTPNVSKKVKHLYYVGGNTVPGIGLPMCLIGAELVCKRIAGIRRGGALQSIEELRS